MQLSMPSASTSTLSSFERFDIALVPFDHGAIIHRGVGNRHQMIEPVAGENKAPDMLAEMARKAHQLTGNFEHACQRRVGGIEAELGDLSWVGLARI